MREDESPAGGPAPAAGPTRDERARRRNRTGPSRPGRGSGVTVRVLVSPPDAALAADALAQAGFWVWVEGARPLLPGADAVVSAERRLPWRTPSMATLNAQVDGVVEALTAASVAYDLVGLAVEPVPRPSWLFVRGDYGDVSEYVLAGPPEHTRREAERVARRYGVPAESLSLQPVADLNLTATRDLLRHLRGHRPAIAYLAVVGVGLLAAVAWRVSRAGPAELVAVLLVLGAALGIFALRRQHGTSFVRPLVVQLATILPLFTAFLIGVVHYAYASFYDPFGVVPAEVGLTSQAMLAQQGFFIVLWLLVIVTLSLMAYGAFWLVYQVLGLERRLDLVQATMLPLIVALMIVTVLALTYENGAAAAAAAQAGRPYDAFAGGFWWPQVREVEVLTTEPDQPGFARGARLLYLGHANGVSVFFDLTSRSTVRLRDVRQIRYRSPP